MVFNATFNNISDIPWRSVLLMEETEVPGETTDQSQVTDKLYYMMLYRIKYTSPWKGFELTTSVVIGIDYICSCKSNYQDHDGPLCKRHRTKTNEGKQE